MTGPSGVRTGVEQKGTRASCKAEAVRQGAAARMGCRTILNTPALPLRTNGCTTPRQTAVADREKGDKVNRMTRKALPLRALGLRSLATALVLSAALCAQAQEVSITPANGTGVYPAGDTAAWNIDVKGDPSGLSNLRYEIKPGALHVSKSGVLKLAGAHTVFTAVRNDPGSLLLEVTGREADGKTFTALGGALFSPDKIKPSAPAPADFDAFWKAKLAELAAVPMDPVITPEPSGVDGVNYALITLRNIRGTHVQGQIAWPAKGDRFPALLIPQWAGVYSLDKAWAVDRAKQGWLVLNFQAHDIPAVGPKSFYDDLFAGPLKNYWAIGNQDRDTSYFLRMYLGCYRAADYLTHRADWDGRTLVVMGASQGGLQTLLTAAIYPKVTAALALVPAGCDQTGPEAGREPGWPQWYEHAQGKDPAKVLEASRYYDIANFTPKIRCPVLVGEGLIDTVCPIASTFAAYNEIPAPKHFVVLPIGTHQQNQDAYNRLAEEWLATLREGRMPDVNAAN
ncbi:acetyl esterase Axe7A precursor [mine drainage metagenome]|uniref:Acetyl esterase Axe7A n=1 Tax=mine drainage metagenome TaxID=410659 RepID=A0A1J5S603_9ZZZZ